ncbi:MAG TPA: hypothetical protein VKF42_03395 [Chitinivibrionales bacterium]|jgi:hypothetical protein|nr:hypothetical protein [Chitinivibrionales bacterium]
MEMTVSKLENIVGKKSRGDAQYLKIHEHKRWRAILIRPTVAKAWSLLIYRKASNAVKPRTGEHVVENPFNPAEGNMVMNKSDTAICEATAFMTEDCFQNMLIQERKRTERFGAHFKLLLIDIGRILNKRPDEKEPLLQNFELALESSTREIDWQGWYLHYKLLGILCPRATTTDTNRIIDRLRLEFGSFLAPDEAGSLKIYCLSSPDTKDEQDAKAPAGAADKPLP